jgi:cysteinyl-tRNA synthetase
MVIFDSATRTKRPFEPIRPGRVDLYVCGPTVYDDAHLGHARSALSFDLLARTFRALGYRVTLAKNFTDIDDKILAKMEQTGQSLQEITDHYIARYLDEMGQLGVRRADIEPKATESLDAIEAMIQRLIDRGYAYRTDNGDVYFDTTRDAGYGSLSHRASDAQSQSRVAHTDQKRDPKDFALWKACEADETVCFDLPFSSGRPGWHIECSAMIEKHFEGTDTYSIDIHGGGADLLFPHHENEAAQSRCAPGHALAKYWMHNGFVQVDGEKMSKSLGNSFFLKDALAQYDGEILRYYLIGVHYRNDFNFNEVDLLAAKKRLDKLYRLKKRLVPSAAAAEPDPEFRAALLAAMEDDLNVSEAYAAVDTMINAANEALDTDSRNATLKKRLMANLALIDAVLGFGGKNPYAYFQLGLDPDLIAQVEALLVERADAKANRDYARADAIRAQLAEMEIAIMDTPDGTVWEKVYA